MNYLIGDRLICRVSDDHKIIFDFSDFRYSHLGSSAFEVIGFYEGQYLILVDWFVEDNYLITSAFIKKHKLSLALKDCHCFLIKESFIGGRQVIDPYEEALSCKWCKERLPYASSNQKDGSFVCYRCRTDPRIRHNFD